MYVFEDLRKSGMDVRQFQVLQVRPGEARVRFVSEGNGDDIVRFLEVGFAERLGGLRVKATHVNSIERAASGKIQLIIRKRAPQGE